MLPPIDLFTFPLTTHISWFHFTTGPSPKKVPKKSQNQGGATRKARAAVKTRGSPLGAGTQLTQLSATDHSATVEAEERGGDFSVARLHRSNHRGSRHWRRRHTHIPRSHRQQVEWGRAVHVELHFLGSEYVSWRHFFLVFLRLPNRFPLR